MKIFNKQKNRVHTIKQRGFTLVETIIAVFILTLAVNSLLGLITKGLFSARYANNEITANYLAEEAIDYIRNDRDTYILKNTDSNWNNFLDNYGDSINKTKCFSPNGCKIEPLLNTISACSSNSPWTDGTVLCDVLYYDSGTSKTSNGDYYTYKTPKGNIQSNFKRQIKMSMNGASELDIKVNIEWQNGNLVRSKSLNFSLLDWQP